MIVALDHRIPQWGARVPRVAGMLAMAGGLVVLVGWVLNNSFLKSPLPAATGMKANAALSIFVAGAALLLLTRKSNRAATVLGAFVAVIGLLTLAEYVLGADLRIDQLLFRDLPLSAMSLPGRMAGTTAFCYFALGIALMLSARPHLLRTAQLVTLVVAFFSVVALLSYLYDVGDPVGIGRYTTMGLNSAVLLLIVCAGVLFLDPTTGVMGIVMSDSVGGAMARRLLPAAIIAPVIVGWFRLGGARIGLYDSELGQALFAVSTIVVLSAVVWFSARSLVRVDVERQQAEAQLRQFAGTLEQSVAEATSELTRSEAHFRGLLESAPDAMVIVDDKGLIVFVNAQAESLFGYRREELARQPVELLVPTRYRDNHAAHRTEYVEDPHHQAMTSGRELYGLRKDGSEFPAEIRLSPLDTKDSTLVSSAIRDISTRKQSEEKIRSSLAEKELLLKELHHRVKNNLQVITSLLKLESESVTDARALRSFRESLERVRSMALLHEKLYQSDDLGHVDLADYLRHLALTLVHNTGTDPERVRLAFAFDQVTLGMDFAVPCGLIANELISNALEHAFPAERRGEIRIELRKDAGTLRFSVADNGVGLPDAIDIRTTGSLGLQLVGLLVDQAHGTIRMERGNGTRFEIALPHSGPGAESAGSV